MEKPKLSIKILIECLGDSLPVNAKDVSLHTIQRITEHGATSLLYSFLISYILYGEKVQKELVIKLYLGGSEDGLAEFTALKILEKNGFCTPIAYCFEPGDGKLSWPFLIMEKIAGNKPAVCYRNNYLALIEKMANLLVAIHKIRLPAGYELDLLRERHKAEKQNLQDVIFFIKNRCPNFLGFSPLNQRRFVEAIKKLNEFELHKYQPALLHMDFEPNHVLVTERGFSVFDWGDVAIGDPAYDVARTYHILKLIQEPNKPDLANQFVESYERFNKEKLLNLPYWKDMFAVRLSIRYGLSPFDRIKFLNYGLIVDLCLGYLFGRIQTAQRLRPMQALNINHHTPIYSNIKKTQNYALNYLENGRYL
jgi:hypothetical protein